MISPHSACLASAFLVLLAGCASFDTKDFHLSGPVEPRLPPLRLVFDDEAMFAQLGSYVFVQDIKEILGCELPQLACDAGGTATGTLRVSVPQPKVHSVFWLPLVPSILTLTMINIIGFPFCGQSATVTYRLTVEDAGGATVGAYEGTGSTSQWAAYYWGYSGVGAASTEGAVAGSGIDLPRATIAGASVRAVDRALQALAADAPRVRAKLAAH